MGSVTEFRNTVRDFIEANPRTYREKNSYTFTLILGWPGSPETHIFGYKRAKAFHKMTGLEGREFSTGKLVFK
jgi:hypothetical protein